MAPVVFERFIGYATRAGLLCAMAYRVRGKDLYGWWTGRDAGAENCSGCIRRD